MVLHRERKKNQKILLREENEFACEYPSGITETELERRPNPPF